MTMLGARRVLRVLLLAGIAAASAAIWLGYQRPAFAVWLSSAMWLCT